MLTCVQKRDTCTQKQINLLLGGRIARSIRDTTLLVQTCHWIFMVSYSDFLMDLRCFLSSYVESQEWYPSKNAHAYIIIEISENKMHILFRIKSHTSPTIVYIPLSVIHARLPHKIFSFSKLLNPRLSLQNPRRLTTAKQLNL